MPQYYFKLVDTYIVSDHGVPELADEAAASEAAANLARSVREIRPDLVGQHCSISVTDESELGSASFRLTTSNPETGKLAIAFLSSSATEKLIGAQRIQRWCNPGPAEGKAGVPATRF
jgi:hypothetical protein